MAMAGAKQGDTTADWQCPNADCVNHTKFVFGSKSACPKCGSSPHGPSAPAKQEDWACPNLDCLNSTKMVFGKHSACPKCGTAKHAEKPGDWACPNMSCVNHKNTVFASKHICPKCGAPRPGAGGKGGCGGGCGYMMQHQMPMMSHHMQMHMPPMMKGGGGYGGFGGGFGGGFAPKGMDKGGGKGEDWQCPNRECMNNSRGVFGKHMSCPQCSTPKPQPRGFGGGGGGGFGGGGGGGGKGHGSGDWQCPNIDCINHKKGVFGKHESCPSCMMPKPSNFESMDNGGGGGGKGGKGGADGDWQCPNGECINNKRMVFASKPSCPQCGTEKPLGGGGGARPSSARYGPY